MTAQENVAASVDDERDDLETIKGVGPAFADALNIIGIRRFADLAQYTPDQLSTALLEQASARVPPERIEADNWIGQARELARRVNTERRPPEERAEVAKEPEEAPPELAWRQHAGFSLFFDYLTDEHGERAWQTRVYHDESGEEALFPGTETALWVNWILERAKLPDTTAEPIAAAARAADEIAINGGDTMDEVKIQRGGHEVTFKKLPDRFAVRLKQGRATSEAALESSLGRPTTAVRHVDSAAPANMEIFVVEDAAMMEQTVDELRESPTADVVSHVYALDDTPGGEVIPTGTMTIQFKPDVEKTEREEILAEFGLEVVEDLDFLPDGYTVRLTDGSKENPLKIAAKLQQREEIETAEPDLSFKVAFQHVPDDTLYPQQWHLKNRGDRLGLRAGADVKAEEAWEHTRGSRDITICVIDDGFDLGHPEFNLPGKIVAPRDFGQHDFDPNPVFEDDNHGTACAGVALAEENGTGVVGLAPGSAFMPVRMAPWLTDDAIVSYFQYAIDHGADVVSCSWSARAWYFPLSTKMHAIIHHAATQGRRNKKGCVILFAAGNEDRPLNGLKYGQPSHQGFALHPDVIAVAASNSLDRRSSYSNYGPELAICAPSSGFPGRRVVTTDRRGTSGYTSNDYTSGFGGTSSSTPLAAGLAALILSVNPELTSEEVKRIMMDTADKIDEGNGQYANGHSPYYGHGRINAHTAVERVAGPPTDEEERTGIEVEVLGVELSVIGPAHGVPTRRLMAEDRFQVSGPGAEALTAGRVPYRIDVHTVDVETEASNLVASEQGQLQPQEFEYTSRLQFPIPKPGRYELQSRVSLSRPSGEISALHRGPTVRVTP